MTKPEIVKALTAAGIQHNPASSKAVLEALLPVGAAVEPTAQPTAETSVVEMATPVAVAASEPAAAATPASAGDVELDIIDPEIARPRELPLLIKPSKGGEWKNEEQAAYAKILNAAAYERPQYWARVKTVELARLIEIGNDPSRYYVYTGTAQAEEASKISYKNKLHE